MLPDIVQFLPTLHFSAGQCTHWPIGLALLVPAFIAANLQPPNSPDLNPVDYKVWGTMQDHVYWAKMRDVDDLKQCVIDV